jgi:hypothetical protein
VRQRKPGKNQQQTDGATIVGWRLHSTVRPAERQCR